MRDRAQLGDARSRQQADEIAQFERLVSADEAAIENARLQSAYAEMRSPINGVAGLRLIDPDNMVRAALWSLHRSSRSLFYSNPGRQTSNGTGTCSGEVQLCR